MAMFEKLLVMLWEKFLPKRDKEYLKTYTISKCDGSWYDKPVFHSQFAKQVFNILILFSWCPQKGHKYVDKPSFKFPNYFKIMSFLYMLIG